MRTLSLQIFKELLVIYLKKNALLFKCSCVPTKMKLLRCETRWPLEDLFLSRRAPSSNGLWAVLQPPTYRNPMCHNRNLYILKSKEKSPSVQNFKI